MKNFAKYLGVFFGLILIFTAVPAFATTGFVDSPLWITPSKPNDGDSVQLSSVFRNEENETISGTILFYDNETLLARKPITILAGDVGFISTRFDIAAGNHQFSATMSNASTLTSSGRLGVVVVAKATVALPEQFVPKVVVVTAQAGTNSGGSVDPILNQIDKAQTSVLKKIPDPAKKTIGTAVGNIENWRTTSATNFSENRDDAKVTIDAESKDVIEKGTSTVLGQPTQNVVVHKTAGPYTYLRYYFFKMLAFLFSMPFIFYLLAVFLLYILLRFVVLRIVRMVRNRRGRNTETKPIH